MKQKTRRKLLGVLLALAMVLGLMPGMSLTAYAGTGDKFVVTISGNGKQMPAVVESSQKFSCEEHTFGDLDMFILQLYNLNFEAERKCVATAPTVSGGDGAVTAGLEGDYQYIQINQRFEGTVTVSGKYNNGTNDFDYSLSLSCSDYTPATGVSLSPNTDKTIDVGEIVAFTASVTPDTATQQMAKVNVSNDSVEYPLWVGGKRVTSANKNDVLGSADEGATVTYTPASDTTPATLTLNEANITTGYPDSPSTEVSGIYYEGEGALDIVLAEGSDNSIEKTDGGFGYGIHSKNPNAGVTISGTGTLTVKGSDYGIKAENNVTINGGNVSVEVLASGISAANDVTIKGCTVSAASTISGGHGIIGGNNVTIEDGDVTASSTGSDSDGIKAYSGFVTISGGKVVASGKTQAIVGNVKNSIAGIGWTDTAGTEGEAEIAVNTAGQTLSYKKVQFTAVAVHTHSFTYSVNGATITATCTADGCTLTENKATLTIEKPTLETYGGTGSAAATLTGLTNFNSATGKTVAETEIKYVGRDGTTYTESTTAPTNAGKYTAKITLSGVKTSEGEGKSVIASVDYEIAKAATTVTTAPTAGEITYGKTLADSALTGGTASVAGTFAWKDPTVAPAVSDSQKTQYDVVFTPTDANYSTAECKVKLIVNKANPTNTVGQLSAICGQTLADVALPTADNGTWSWVGDTTTKLENVGPTTYIAKFTPYDTDNYNIIENITVQIQVTEKPFAVPATVTANSRTYDGTEKPLVTVTGEATGGTMRYALGTETGATQSYTTDIPAKTDAGTYYVWYKAVGDGNHSDSEPKCVEAKIEPAPAEVPPVSVTAHVQRKGTLAAVADGKPAGTTGKRLRMESLRLNVDGASEVGGIEYRGHVQRKGWEKSWARDGAMAGTEGKSRRLEAVQIRLWGDMASKYDVYYRVHVQRYGWMAWAKNGEEAGTQGMSRRVEAIQVVLVEKDAPAPAADFQGATQAYGKAFAKK